MPPPKMIDSTKNIVLMDKVEGSISPVEFELLNLDNKFRKNLHTYKSKKHFLPEISTLPIIETNEMKSLYQDERSPSSATLKMNKRST